MKLLFCEFFITILESPVCVLTAITAISGDHSIPVWPYVNSKRRIVSIKKHHDFNGVSTYGIAEQPDVPGRYGALTVDVLSLNFSA